jgi:hypothetical protein
VCRARILEELAQVKMSRLNSSQDIQLTIALDELKSDLARYDVYPDSSISCSIKVFFR